MDQTLLRAQHGEDLLLAERFGHREGGHYVEVGALNGEYLSNTYYFEKALGWTGVLVEPNPDQAALCREHRPASTVAAFAAVGPGGPTTVTLNVTEGNEGYSTLSANRTYSKILAERNLETTEREVAATTLDAILEDAALPSIDFITVDVEGHERDVFRGFDVRRWQPTVILVERASWAPDPVIAGRLFRAGYGCTRRVVINDWYEPLPPVRRTLRLVASYVLSLPLLARLVVRNVRVTGLLGLVRRRRIAAAGRKAGEGSS